MSEKQKVIIGAALMSCCFCLFVLITLSIIFSGLYRVEPKNIGILYDDYSLQLNEDEIYREGLYVLGVGHDFIQYKTSVYKMIFSDIVGNETLQTSTFDENADLTSSIQARQIKGMKMDVDIYIAYKLTTSEKNSEQIAQILTIYKQFGKNWQQFIEMVILQEIRDLCAQKESSDFWENRNLIGQEIFTQIKEFLKEFHIDLITANIINLSFVKEFEDIQTQTQVAKQNIILQKKVLEQTDVDLDQQYQQAVNSQKISNKQADYDAEILTQIYTFLAETEDEIYGNQLDAIKKIFAFVGNDKAKIIDFLKLYNLKYGKNKSNFQELQPPLKL